MRNLIIVAGFVVITACQSRDTSSSASDSTAIDSSANAVVTDTSEVIMQPESEVIIPESIGDEVFILPGTTVFTDTTLTEQFETDASQLRKGTRISSTQRYYPQEAEYCDRHPNLQVQLEDGSTVWVPGEGVLVSGQSANSSLGSFGFGDQEYTIMIAYDTGIGPSDSDGLTGCESYEVIYFVNKEGKMDFLGASDASAKAGVTTNYQGYFCLISSEGGSATVSDIAVGEDEIRMMLSINYQDGGDTAIVHIGTDGQGFIAKSIELETRD